MAEEVAALLALLKRCVGCLARGAIVSQDCRTAGLEGMPSVRVRWAGTLAAVQ